MAVRRSMMLVAALLMVGICSQVQAAYIGGESYKALEFSGSTWVEIPSTASSFAGKEFSFEAWVKVPVGDMTNEAKQLIRPIVSRYDTSIEHPTNEMNDFVLQVNPQGQVVFFVGGSDELGFLMKSNVTLEPFRWYHIAFSIQYQDINSAFPQRASLYVDDWHTGVIAREKRSISWLGAGHTRVVLDNEPIALGKYQNDNADYASGQYFIGLLDEVRIWRGKRQGADIQNFAFRTVTYATMDQWAISIDEGGSSSTTLVASYNFNAGSEVTAFDQSTNEFDAVIHTGPENHITTYQASDIPIVSYVYAVRNIPLQIPLYGINSVNIEDMSYHFKIQHDATLRGNVFQYDASNSGAAENQYPVDLDVPTPGIGQRIASGDAVAANSLVYVFTPGNSPVGRFWYSVTDGDAHSSNVEVRIVVSCTDSDDKIDDCGVCNGMDLAKDNCSVCFGDNKSCAGCDGVPNSGLEDDKCGICNGNNTCVGCDGVAWSNKTYDSCNVCGGNDTCLGCDGKGGQYDNCDICNGNNTCVGCDGVAWSNKTYDICHECGGNGSSCLGCDGVYNSGLELDDCGDCGGNGSRCAGCDGSGGGVKDVCGVCRGNGDTCGGCDDKGGKLDDCGVCNGDNSTCTCVHYHGYHIQELDYVLLQWGLTNSIRDLTTSIEYLDEALELLTNYRGDLDLASVVLYLQDFIALSHDYDTTVSEYKRELDISLGNIWIGHNPNE